MTTGWGSLRRPFCHRRSKIHMLNSGFRSWAAFPGRPVLRGARTERIGGDRRIQVIPRGRKPAGVTENPVIDKRHEAEKQQDRNESHPSAAAPAGSVGAVLLDLFTLLAA